MEDDTGAALETGALKVAAPIRLADKYWTHGQACTARARKSARGLNIDSRSRNTGFDRFRQPFRGERPRALCRWRCTNYLDNNSPAMLIAMKYVSRGAITRASIGRGEFIIVRPGISILARDSISVRAIIILDGACLKNMFYAR